MKRAAQFVFPLMLAVGIVSLIWGGSQLWQTREAEAACSSTPSCNWDVTDFGCDNLWKCTCGMYGEISFTCYYEDGKCINNPSTLVRFQACYRGTCTCNCVEPDGGCGDGFHWSSATCKCIRNSPIIVDVAGNGFSLTSGAEGADFNFSNDGFRRMAWTTVGSDDAFLTLPHNGVVDNGADLFGNLTPQPESPDPNGFLALAEYDKPEKGGNSDKSIDSRDSVFSQLRLWQDANHNGVSEASELHTLPELGVASISVDFKESKRTDRYGNKFRFRAKVKDVHGAQLGRWAWDVYLADGQ